jgi:SMODS-associating 4TM effector domain
MSTGRVILEPQQGRERRHGAAAQERFDTDVFGLPWSTSVVGPQPAPEDLRDWGRKHTEDGLRDWYADARPAQHPTDVLLCQRSVITWARQDHTTYAHLLRWAVGIGVGLTLLLGVALDLSLGEYLLRLGIPALPAALDVLDIAKGNAKVAEVKARLENEADALLSGAQATARAPSVAECRELQNGIYATRLLPGVPNWMYKLTRTQRQGNMEQTVRSQVDSLPAALR